MRIYVYNRDTHRIEKFDRELSDQMPYTSNYYLRVSEFRGSSQSTLLWTDKRTMQTFMNFRRFYGNPIYVGYCFKRIWEGGHAPQSQHYAGNSFDTGQNLTRSGRNALHDSAVRFGSWSYVEPLNLTPTWVHFDKRLFPPACPGGGYISVSLGSRGVYVLVLQDALNALGFTGSGLDGIFGEGTRQAVMDFQRSVNLTADGLVGCSTWSDLTTRAVGIGQTATVVMP